MNKNIEIKAQVADLTALRRVVESLADGGPEILEQEDTFFTCRRGRLKLRRFTGSLQTELIYYERADSCGPKESWYIVHRTADPHGLRDVLSAALGVRGVVRKRRTVYMIGQTRVHLDQVEGLGEFVELEVVLRPDQDTRDGLAIAQRLMTELGVLMRQLVDTAYVDMLE
jgi:predicted adenylyl cyclase CyaB